MKNEKQIQDKLSFLTDKIILAKETGKGYNSFSDLRRDETTITTLEWVLDIPVKKGARKQ